MPLDPRSVLAVTGANSKFFLHTLILIESYLHHCGSVVKVCDYGLSEGERIFFERRGCLVPAPRPIEQGRHAWYYKASLCDYVEWPEAGAVFWLDADAVVVDNIRDRLLLAAGDPPGRRDVYACLENECSFGHIFSVLEQAGRMDALEVYRRLGVGAADTYVSSGLFMIFREEFLRTWRDIVWTTPAHVLFEQNAFNLALRSYSAGILDPAVYNVSQRNLLTCRLRESDLAMVNETGERIAFLHMTANADDILVGESVAAPVPRGTLTFGELRLRRPHNTAIRMQQDAFLSRAVRKYGDEMVELGIAQLSA